MDMKMVQVVVIRIVVVLLVVEAVGVYWGG